MLVISQPAVTHWHSPWLLSADWLFNLSITQSFSSLLILSRASHTAAETVEAGTWREPGVCLGLLLFLWTGRRPQRRDRSASDAAAARRRSTRRNNAEKTQHVHRKQLQHTFSHVWHPPVWVRRPGTTSATWLYWCFWTNVSRSEAWGPAGSSCFHRCSSLFPAADRNTRFKVFLRTLWTVDGLPSWLWRWWFLQWLQEWRGSSAPGQSSGTDTHLDRPQRDRAHV